MAALTGGLVLVGITWRIKNVVTNNNLGQRRKSPTHPAMARLAMVRQTQTQAAKSTKDLVDSSCDWHCGTTAKPQNASAAI
jgi:hypothetical protein